MRVFEMKTLIFLSGCCCLVFSADPNDDGKYFADDSGQYVPTSEGKYVPDNSGQYLPDDSGRYLDDGTGNYRDTLTGRYINRNKFYNPSTYRGDSRSSSSVSSFGGKSSTFRGNFNQNRGGANPPPPPAFSPNLVEAGNFDQATHQKDIVIAASPTTYKSLSDSFGIAGAGGGSVFGNIASAATHAAAVRHHGGAGGATRRFSATGQYRGGDDSRWRILKQNGDVGENGYHWDYETENGIIADEAGQVVNRGTDKEVMRAQGSYTYTGPDNVVYTVTYTADENGFVPQGAHLPTPPPIPEAILRALDFQRQSGKL